MERLGEGGRIRVAFKLATRYLMKENMAFLA